MGAACLLAFALAGCVETGAPVAGDQGLALRIASDDACIPDAPFTLEVYIDDDGDAGLTSGDTLVSSTDLELTAIANSSDFPDWPQVGVVIMGDAFQTIAAGSYLVRVRSPSAGIVPLDPVPAVQQVTVLQGETAEVVFLFGCDGESIGALDGTVVVDLGPDIIDWEYPDGKDTPVCGTTVMNGTFDEPSGDDYEVWCHAWDPTQDPDVDAPVGVQGNTTVSGTATFSCEVLCEQPGIWNVSVYAQDSDQFTSANLGASNTTLSGEVLLTRFDTVTLCADGGGEDVCFQPEEQLVIGGSSERVQTAVVEMAGEVRDSVIEVEHRVVEQFYVHLREVRLVEVDGGHELKLGGTWDGAAGFSVVGTAEVDHAQGGSVSWALGIAGGSPSFPVTPDAEGALKTDLAFNTADGSGVHDGSALVEIDDVLLLTDGITGRLVFDCGEVRYNGGAGASRDLQFASCDQSEARGYYQQLDCTDEPEPLDPVCAEAWYGQSPSCDVTCPSVLGNPDCFDQGYPYGFKIDEAPAEGKTYYLTAGDGELLGETPESPEDWVSIDATHLIDDEVRGFDWSASLGIDLVLVKAATRSNAYRYDPEAFSGTDLYTAYEAHEISHVTFCYD